MMRKNTIFLFCALLSLVILSACGGGEQTPEPTQISPDAIYTAAAETMAANIAATALAQPTDTPVPSPTVPVATATLGSLWTPVGGEQTPLEGAGETPGAGETAGATTPLPGAATAALPGLTTPGTPGTPAAIATATKASSGSAGPCFNMQFAGETIPDDTQFFPGETFEKTWDLKNLGPCSWTEGTEIVPIQFSHPDEPDKRMGAPKFVEFDRDYKPGETATIGVKLTAPQDKGVYTIYWRCQDPNGFYFGTMFSVRIEVVWE